MSNPMWADRPKVRIFSKINKDTFRRLIGEISWETELINKNVNEAIFVFNQKLSVAYNKSFPFKRLSRKSAKGITSGLKLLDHLRSKTIYQTPIISKINFRSNRGKQNSPQNI